MRTICTAPMRGVVMAVLVSAALAASPSIASAQIGVGARLAWVTADTEADVDRCGSSAVSSASSRNGGASKSPWTTTLRNSPW